MGSVQSERSGSMVGMVAVNAEGRMWHSGARWGMITVTLDNGSTEIAHTLRHEFHSNSKSDGGIIDDTLQ